MSKDYICLHCAKKAAGTCKYLPNSNTVTCGSFWPNRIEKKGTAMKIRKNVNKIYEQGGHL